MHAPEDRLVKAAFYPEGPLVHGGSLYYTEFDADAVHRICIRALFGVEAGQQQQQQSDTYVLPCGSGPCGLAHCAGLVLTGPDVVVTCYGSHELRALSSGRTLHRLPYPNDVCADGGYGGLFVTSSGELGEGDPFHPAATASGAVYHLSPCGALLRPLTLPCIHYANGVVFDGASARLFVSEHLRNRILVYDVKRDAVMLPRPFGGAPSRFIDLGMMSPCAIPLLGPDGLALDENGRTLYVAHFGGGAVLKIDADSGALVARIKAEGGLLNVTNVAVARPASATAPALLVITAAGGERAGSPDGAGSVGLRRSTSTTRAV